LITFTCAVEAALPVVGCSEGCVFRIAEAIIAPVKHIKPSAKKLGINELTIVCAHLHSLELSDNSQVEAQSLRVHYHHCIYIAELKRSGLDQFTLFFGVAEISGRVFHRQVTFFLVV
jgi:hypothetical protein